MTDITTMLSMNSLSLAFTTRRCRCVTGPMTAALALVISCLLAGCGRTVSQGATEQLLASNAVDRTIGQIDFRVLSGKTVYLDTQYINNVKGVGFVNADYIVSSLRQQLVAARCLLQDDRENAEYVVEARIGALGTDGHEVTYGIPANNLLNAAANLVPTAPQIPTIPEIAFAKRNDQLAAAKVGVFAYHRMTREPVWQAGLAQSRSTAKDTWILGAGPFQRGTIHDGTRFAGSKLGLPTTRHDSENRDPLVSYDEEVYFKQRPREESVANGHRESAQPPCPQEDISPEDGNGTERREPQETAKRPASDAAPEASSGSKRISQSDPSSTPSDSNS